MLAFLHIPKTAGTSFATVLHHHHRGEEFHYLGNAFSRPELLEAPGGPVRAASGHVTIAQLDRLVPGAPVATILRHPVSRTLSHYRYLADGRGRGFVPPDKHFPMPALSLQEALAPGGYVPDNLQTRMLCGIDSPLDELPVDALERAKGALSERVEHVGVTERFDEFLAVVAVAQGWPTVASGRSRVGGRRLEPSVEERRFVEERNQLDLELYEHASSLAGAAVDRGGAAVREEARVLEAAAGVSSAEVRSLPLDAQAELARRERSLARAYDEQRRCEEKLARIKAKRRARKAT
jgi:hypothetical protein